MSPHVAELVDLIVRIHVASGGTDADRLRALIVGTCDIATLDGEADSLNRFSAGIEATSLMQRMRQGAMP